MLKKNKWTLIISSLLILTPMVFGILFWEDAQLPGASKPMFMVCMPLILLVLQWVCIVFTLKDPKNKEQSPKIVNMILWIVPGISVFLSGITYLAALGMASQTFRFAPLLFGVFFVLMGNFMPKCKQNSTGGIKVKWTLQNEENWNATHRFAGKVWVFGGILFMTVVFLPEGWLIASLLICVFALAFAPMIYSYCYYRKQVKAGVEMTPYELPEGQKKVKQISLVIVGLILIGCFVLMFTGKVEVTCGEEALTINATYWEDVTVRYADIEKVEFRESVPGTRIYGFGSAKLLLGTFENAEFGLYARYTRGDGNCIVLTVKGEVIVLSGANNEKTREIYETLLAKGAGQ